ncbi:MAG: adenylosuccinate lyase family protein [Alphaproteobacteria bacterium]|nr:adenylosuccinate lyase family protein [Alphaproteobacteria bacterium]
MPRALYDSQSKALNDRGISLLLTKKAKVESWLKVEAALALAQAELGIIPTAAAENIAANCNIEQIDFAEMDRIMANIGHGFVPFLKVLISQCSPAGGKYVHYGITTQNIQQTGQLYILKQVNDIFKSFIADILTNLAKLAHEHANTVMAGRTHGKHAIPITFGYKVSVWISEILQSVERLQESEKRVFSVMMGGAVGSFNSMGELGIKVQDMVAEKLNMSSMPVPSRNIQSHKQEYIMNLALLCNALHKMAEEVYYTGIEEFGELSEGFKKGTIGSSTMPQKINPKNAKGIIANSQKLYSTITSGLFSSVRLFEGDSSSYMLFDALLEEAVELTREVLMRAEELSRTLGVNRGRMYQNILLSGGLDNSEYVMMCIASKLGKDKAHTLVYDTVMQTLEGKDYLTALLENSEISALFSKEEIENMLKPENYVGIGSELANKMANEALRIAKLLV